MSNAKAKQAFLMRRGPTIIGTFALFVWGHGIIQIFPFPPTSDLLSIEMQWSAWREGLAYTLVGLTTGVLACYAVRFWWMAILLTSGMVCLITLPLLVSDIFSQNAAHWLEVQSIVFGRLIDEDKIGEAVHWLYFLYVYPLYHFMLVMGTMLYLFWFRRNGHHVSPTSA